MLKVTKIDIIFDPETTTIRTKEELSEMAKKFPLKMGVRNFIDECGGFVCEIEISTTIYSQDGHSERPIADCLIEVENEEGEVEWVSKISKRFCSKEEADDWRLGILLGVREEWRRIVQTHKDNPQEEYSIVIEE